jgi:undecaprenyl-diphosphatase
LRRSSTCSSADAGGNSPTDATPAAAGPRFTLRQAVALGLLHGPAELAPVSSSGHTALLAWYRGWNYGPLDAGARKRFEVALHAGTTAALLIVSRRELATIVRRRSPGASPGLGRVVVLACIPPALAGGLLQQEIEQRLGTPATIAAALAGGSLAMVIAERHGGAGRGGSDAGVLDGLALGAAQAVALIPGVSRSGATRAVARWRGFAPADAAALSGAVGLPVTLGALALKGVQTRHSERSEWATLGAGALASFSSTLAGEAAMRRIGREGSLLPYAAYRLALAAAVIRRLRQNGGR